MDKTAVERQRERRLRLKQDATEYDKYKNETEKGKTLPGKT